jgi:hypothetical protein
LGEVNVGDVFRVRAIDAYQCVLRRWALILPVDNHLVVDFLAFPHTFVNV